MGLSYVYVYFFFIFRMFSSLCLYNDLSRILFSPSISPYIFLIYSDHMIRALALVRLTGERRRPFISDTICSTTLADNCI